MRQLSGETEERDGVFAFATSITGEHRLLSCVEKQIILLPPELITYTKQAVFTKMTPSL